MLRQRVHVEREHHTPSSVQPAVEPPIGPDQTRLTFEGIDASKITERKAIEAIIAKDVKVSKPAKKSKRKTTRSRDADTAHLEGIRMVPPKVRELVRPSLDSAEPSVSVSAPGASFVYHPPAVPMHSRVDVFLRHHASDARARKRQKSEALLPRHILPDPGTTMGVSASRFHGRAVESLQNSEFNAMMYTRIHQLCTGAPSVLPDAEARQLVDPIDIAQTELERGLVWGMMERDPRNSEGPLAWPIGELIKPDLVFPDDSIRIDPFLSDFRMPV
jgi:hypothetical protein